jgi:hypothetical protein
MKVYRGGGGIIDYAVILEVSYQYEVQIDLLPVQYKPIFI